MLVSCKGVQAKYIIRGLQGRMRVGLNVSTVMGEPSSRHYDVLFVILNVNRVLPDNM